MFERILVPLDGSEAAEVAVRVAAQLPCQRLQLLGVEPDLADLSTTARDREAYLESVAAPLREQDRQVDTMVAVGDPAEQIAAMARSADLIVMTSHGRGAMGRLMFGSVADAVVRYAATPTLIVRGEFWQGSTVRRIVVPLDGNPLAEQALPMAVNLATALQVPVHLVRVVDFDPVRASILAGPAAAAASARQHAELARVAQAYLTRLADQYQAPGLTITSEVRVGDPVPELLAVIQPEDLAVLATHARGGLARWFVGSVAEAIVQRGAGPVLLVRSGLQVPSAERGAFNREGSHT